MATAELKMWRGLAFPHDEHHLIGWMESQNQTRDGLPAYQLHKYTAALAYCKQRRVALDVGANLGLWSRVMALDFELVHAFEPVGLYAKCWVQNCKAENAVLHRFALGDKEGTVDMVCLTPGSCGDTSVAQQPGGAVVADAVSMVTLDSFFPALVDVDFVKIDNEGFELFVLRGAKALLRRCRPVVIVEQKRGHGAKFGISDTAAVNFLEKLGMRTRQVISGDYILTW